MLEQKNQLLDELGFNINLKGARYFISASDQLQDFFDKIDNNIENVGVLLPNNIENLDQYIDCIFVEDYGFIFECGKNNYLDEMEKFINSRNINNQKQLELNKKVFGNSTNIKDMLVKISLYLNKETKKEESIKGKKLF